jgi:archaellum component FlaC
MFIRKQKTLPYLYWEREVLGISRGLVKNMSNDEVELGGKAAGEDYEVVPVGPLRKLERRVDELQEENQQGNSTDDELVRDVIDIMKSNQKIVNDMTESTHELKNSVEDLTHKMDEVVDNMNTFMDLLTEASEMDMEGELVGDMETRIAEAIGTKMDEVADDMKQSNQEVVQHLNDINESLRRSYAAQGKDNVVSRSGSGRQQKQRSQPQQPQQQPQEPQQQSESRNPSRSMREGNSDNDSDLDLGSDRDDRMKRLRERFNKTGSDGQ